ncbi:sugar ABC transporter ATP-binding protein [candidate division KSB3 bacterium]|uniref:Autoinducer 2 import ATP-binding protein LsrA n=1 Tax=candidate division KSB3 bacterium TaxID=2044937 RepID=A0A2G6E389_9BACT|nr:MAG: sugar ABC transporter ATP-binding protein [candidate division KSB3 bacterium]PIE28893.1 MAG: sugar ABC transporter ATP-binding protein [candidate division KSB3 bacterium]
MHNGNIVELHQISKAFGGIPVLQNVDLVIRRGLVHGLVGGNGAGKSTLMKILSGIHQPDLGEIRIDQHPEHLKTPADAHAQGIYLVPQEPKIFPYLTVEENILLGLNVKKTVYRQKLQTLMRELNCDFTLGQPGADLTIAKQQLLGLLKALIRESDVIILDEPTSALTSRETTALFQVVKTLVREKNIAVVYITHRLHELFDITDELTVLKNGRIISQGVTSDYTLEDIIQIMVPRVNGASEQLAGHDSQASRQYVRSEENSEAVLDVEHLWGKGFQDVSFSLKKGEILGLTGVVGAGRTEFAEALFGMTPKHSGNVRLNGQEVDIYSPRKAIESGMVYVPENRHLHGGFLEASIKENITASILFRICRAFLRKRLEIRLAQQFIRLLNIKTTGADQKFQYLSGGNQQKVVLGKWLASTPHVIILDEPTRGIDANARKEIYTSIREMAGEGIGVLVISSDFEEIVTLSDRVMIMYSERIVAELLPPKITLEQITFASFGYAKAV